MAAKLRKNRLTDCRACVSETEMNKSRIGIRFVGFNLDSVRGFFVEAVRV
jgi:hypothetical protein